MLSTAFKRFYPRISNLSSRQLIAMEDKYGCHNYHPVPVVISKGEGMSYFYYRIICLGSGRKQIHGLFGCLLGRKLGTLPPQDSKDPD